MNEISYLEAPPDCMLISHGRPCHKTIVIGPTVYIEIPFYKKKEHVPHYIDQNRN